MASREDDADRRMVALLDEYCRVLREIVSRLCPRTLGIHREDIEQEARVRLWRALVRERNIANPASYLYRVVTSVTIDAIRQVRARREVPLSDASDGDGVYPVLSASAPTPEQSAADRELLGLMREALATLAVDRRRAVSLHLQGLTTTEIGALLGWTEARARNLVHRGLKDLKQRLQAELTKGSDAAVRSGGR